MEYCVLYDPLDWESSSEYSIKTLYCSEWYTFRKQHSVAFRMSKTWNNPKSLMRIFNGLLKKLGLSTTALRKSHDQERPISNFPLLCEEDMANWTAARVHIYQVQNIDAIARDFVPIRRENNRHWLFEMIEGWELGVAKDVAEREDLKAASLQRVQELNKVLLSRIETEVEQAPYVPSVLHSVMEFAEELPFYSLLSNHVKTLFQRVDSGINTTDDAIHHVWELLRNHSDRIASALLRGGALGLIEH